MSCRISENQPLYEALLNKADSYLPAHPYRAAAYKKAAQTITECIYDLRNDYLFVIPNVGPIIAQYIRDFYNNSYSTCEMADKPAEASPVVPVSVPKCKVPANQFIYEALLNKADSYLPDQPYKAAAYKKAAQTITELIYDLSYDYLFVIPNVGPSIAQYIRDFYNNSYSTCEMADKPEEHKTAEVSNA
jgi:DNA polymerase/3'-5' exonuclease PolX